MEKDNQNNEQRRDIKNDLSKRIDEKIARLSLEEDDFEVRFAQMQKERELQREQLREQRQRERAESQKKRSGWKKRFERKEKTATEKVSSVEHEAAPAQKSVSAPVSEPASENEFASAPIAEELPESAFSDVTADMRLVEEPTIRVDVRKEGQWIEKLTAEGTGTASEPEAAPTAEMEPEPAPMAEIVESAPEMEPENAPEETEVTEPEAETVEVAEAEEEPQEELTPEMEPEEPAEAAEPAQEEVGAGTAPEVEEIEPLQGESQEELTAEYAPETAETATVSESEELESDSEPEEAEVEETQPEAAESEASEEAEVIETVEEAAETAPETMETEVETVEPETEVVEPKPEPVPDPVEVVDGTPEELEEESGAKAVIDEDAQLMEQLDAIVREREQEQRQRSRKSVVLRGIMVRAKVGLRKIKKNSAKRKASRDSVTVHSNDAEIGLSTKAPGLTFEKKSAILWEKYKSTSSVKLRRKRRKLRVKERRFAHRMADRVERADRVFNVWSRRKLFRQLDHFWMKGMELLERAEENKVLLAEIMAIALFCAAAVTTFIGHITAYEYAYNGKALGITKNKEDVYKTIDAIGDKLGVALDARVEIDKEKDISFREVHGLNLKLDSKDEVLNNLTYMQDLKVVACGIFKDDEQVAILQSAQAGKEVLDAIKNKFTAQTEGKVYDAVSFAENVELRNVSVSLGEIENQDEVLEYMLTGAVEKKIHTVQKGQTFSEIAKMYGLSQSELEGMNPGIQPTRLKIGQQIVLNRDAPILTVQTVETATYTEAIPFETEYQESSSMYEGETSVKRNGTNGQQRVVATIKRNNGEEISREILSTEKLSDPVSKIVVKGTKKAPVRQGTGTFAWPIRNYRISSRFGYRWGRMHNGVDLAASTGTKIYATDGGTVTYAGYKGSFGYLVIINHGGNYESYYAHCSKLLVKKGDKVFQGQNIALVGTTGRTTGPHLHFEIRYLGNPKNPLNYI